MQAMTLRASPLYLAQITRRSRPGPGRPGRTGSERMAVRVQEAPAVSPLHHRDAGKPQVRC